MKGYDSHLIIKHAYDLRLKEIDAIPNGFEKFMTFTLDALKFIDTFQFMASSLDTLVKNLKDKELTKFNHTRSIFKEDTQKICRKGIYPYDQLEDIPHAFRTSYLLKSKNKADQKIRMNKALRDSIHFLWINLMNDTFGFNYHDNDFKREFERRYRYPKT